MCFLKALAAKEGSVSDFEFALNLFFELLGHSLTLGVVHSIKLLLLFPEVIEGLLDLFIEVVVASDLLLGLLAVNLLIEQQFLNLDLIIPADEFFLQNFLPGVVANDIIDII